MTPFKIHRHDAQQNEPLFDTFTVGAIEVNPNTFQIIRKGGIATILTSDGSLVDEPNDVGQSDDALRVHGILWLLSNAACMDWSISLTNKKA